MANTCAICGATINVLQSQKLMVEIIFVQRVVVQRD